MEKEIIIFWFRQDLRLSDNPGLFEAAKNGTVLPIYILDNENPEIFKIGGASRWWLHHSLINLNKSLNGKLNVYFGDSRKIIQELIDKNNIIAVYWNRCYEPWRIKIDTEIKTYLKNINIECTSFNGLLLWEPWTVMKKDNTPYKVYTPYYRKGCLQSIPPRVPLPAPNNLNLIQDQDNIYTINMLKLLPSNKWYKQIEKKWEVGEKPAQKKLTEFLDGKILEYKENRNYPYKEYTSKLSPYLHFGQISPNQIWYKVQDKIKMLSLNDNINRFLSELGWREFSYYLLYHFPELPKKNFQSKFDNFPWNSNKEFLKAWQEGKTGYPIVDAGMRELWQTGYMHNRVRMIVGSFLVKNLLINWQEGAMWFWDCLLDADLANNSMNWQWVAGTGLDSAPYFRIFNPILQGEKFDPEGYYTKHFIPELSKLPNQFLFNPWKAPDDILKTAGIILGKTYPKPIVDLAISRKEALYVYNSISKPSNLNKHFIK